jgi:hypothetical protein
VRRLFDENLSPRLTYLLTSEYPGSEHVRDAGTAAIAQLLRQERQRVLTFEASPEPSVLILSIGPRAV